MPTNIQTKTRMNLALPCDYRKHGIGCPRKRKSIARWCEPHWEAIATTGHVDGRLIPRSAYKAISANAFVYVFANRDHPDIARALDYIRGHVINPGRMPSPPYKKPRGLKQIIEQQVYVELRRLQTPAPVQKGTGVPGEVVTFDRPEPVTAEEVLASCVGVWLAVKLNANLLMNDGECLNFALANGVLLLRRYRLISAWSATGQSLQRRPPGARVRRALGETLRHLSPVCDQIAERLAHCIKETPEQVRARQADENRPLPEAKPNELVVPLPVEPAAPVPAPRLTHYELPARYPRPLLRDLSSSALIAKWSEVERLWSLYPDGKIPVTFKKEN